VRCHAELLSFEFCLHQSFSIEMFFDFSDLGLEKIAILACFVQRSA